MIDRAEILGWLAERDEAALEPLWRRADETRRANVGDEVHLRGLLEISNHCVRACHYCGLRAGHYGLERYRLTLDEIIEGARAAERFGYGTVVLQAGEDPALDGDRVTEIVRAIRAATSLAVSLSLGERSAEELAAWREAGADRYLLRFETSDPELYRKIHPPHSRGRDRFEVLDDLRRLGYEVGTGILIGIPGQTLDDLAGDLERLRTLDPDMIGSGPFIPHPDTPLGAEAESGLATPLVTCIVLALSRLLCPEANIPATTALATLDPETSRELGLQRGANVVMPNLTPVRYRSLYEIYPGKACVGETAEVCNRCLAARIDSIGRRVGTGPGGSRKRRPSPKPSPDGRGNG
jgi:biotin synthase